MRSECYPRREFVAEVVRKRRISSNKTRTEDLLKSYGLSVFKGYDNPKASSHDPEGTHVAVLVKH